MIVCKNIPTVTSIGLILIVVFGIPLALSSNLFADCGVPLCYFGEPKSTEKSVIKNHEKQSWFMFYLFLIIHYITAVFVIYLALKKYANPIIKKEPSMITAPLMFGMIVMLFALTPFLHSNYNECDFAICYLGGPSERQIENDKIEENTVHNKLAFVLIFIPILLSTMGLIGCSCECWNDYKKENSN